MKGNIVKTIKVQDALQIKDHIFIDVRSPSEYTDATIPGAVNIPLFTDAERSRIGTVYKQQNPEKAREVGLEVVAPKLPGLVRQVKEAADNKTPIIFCWRGGERSKNLCSILKMMMISGYRLEGGYKAYRTYILDRLANYYLSAKAIVLHGYTGSGKTMILEKLAKKGHPVLDLEGLAGHRGSAFGSIGIKDVRNQKQFDALLYNRLEELKDQPYILLEAESKRIGRVNMPDFLFMKKEQGIPILVNASLDVRAERIIREYVVNGINQEFLETCHKSLQAIQKKLVQRIGKAGFEEVVMALWRKDLHYVTSVLLTEYYDPLYQHSQNMYDFELEIDVDDLDQGVNMIDQFLQSSFEIASELCECGN